MSSASNFEYSVPPRVALFCALSRRAEHFNRLLCLRSLLVGTLNAAMSVAGLDTRLHCVYLLTSCDPKYHLHWYVGYTPNPLRRLRQHNGELKNGGAVQTRRRGRPWRIVLFISGFLEDRAALRFEYRWHHPDKSPLIREQVAKLVMHSRRLPWAVAVMHVLLNTDEYKQMALRLNVMDPDAYGQVCGASVGAGVPLPTPGELLKVQNVSRDDVAKLVGNSADDDDGFVTEADAEAVHADEAGLIPCTLCAKPVALQYSVRCRRLDCILRVHVACLAVWFYGHADADADVAVVPVTPAPCPACGVTLQWPVLIAEMRKKMNRAQQQVLERRRAELELHRRKPEVAAAARGRGRGGRGRARERSPGAATQQQAPPQPVAATEAPSTPVEPDATQYDDPDWFLNT